MPTYEYGCNGCGHRMEQEQRITEQPLKTCPACGQDQLERLISAVAFTLKGGGWYKDGYGNPTKPRTENQRSDRLQKAIDEDKKKTATAAEKPSSDSSTSSSSSSSSDSSSSSSGSSDKKATSV